MLTVAQSHQQFAEGRDLYADLGIAEPVAEVQVAQRFEVEFVGLELRGYIAAERASVVAHQGTGWAELGEVDVPKGIALGRVWIALGQVVVVVEDQPTRQIEIVLLDFIRDSAHVIWAIDDIADQGRDWTFVVKGGGRLEVERAFFSPVEGPSGIVRQEIRRYVVALGQADAVEAGRVGDGV